MSLAGWAGSSSQRSMYSWLASGPSRLGAFLGSSQRLWLAQLVAYVRYLASPVIRNASTSPLMKRALNHVEFDVGGFPAIQWSAAWRTGARSAQVDGTAARAAAPGAAGGGLASAAGGASAAVRAVTAPISSRNLSLDTRLSLHPQTSSRRTRVLRIPMIRPVPGSEQLPEVEGQLEALAQGRVVGVSEELADLLHPVQDRVPVQPQGGRRLLDRAGGQ